ncbi:MAG: hypothetical protein U0354_20225 [Candidatus Sericytochromatia bacterium]
MNLQELLENEYDSILNLDFDYTDSIESYKKQTDLCSKNKINQNSIELYQAHQKLHEILNTSYISLDDEEKDNYYKIYENHINQSYIFKNLKNKLMNSISNIKSNKYINKVIEKYNLLLLKAIEEEDIKKVNILYYSIRALNRDFESSERLIQFFIKDKQ